MAALRMANVGLEEGEGVRLLEALRLYNKAFCSLSLRILLCATRLYLYIRR